MLNSVDSAVLGKPKLLLCIPLWGREYIAEWLQWSWASLSSQRNLPAVADEFDVSVQIVTRQADCEEIREGFKDLQINEQVRIEVLPLLAHELPNKYTAMTTAVLASMNIAARERAIFVFSGADFIWSDGSLRFLASQLRSKRAVFNWAGIVDRQSATIELMKFRHGGVLQIESRALARILLNNNHPLQESWIVGENLVPKSPWCAIWLSPDSECAVIRSHAPTPTGINFDRFSQSTLNTYLGLLRRFVLDSAETFEPLLGDGSEIVIVSDSDELLVASLDSADREPPPPERAVCKAGASGTTFLSYLAKYQRLQCYISKYLFTKPYILHTGELDDWSKSQILICQNQLILHLAGETRTSVMARLWFLLPSLRWRQRVSSIVLPVLATIRKVYAMKPNRIGMR